MIIRSLLPSTRVITSAKPLVPIDDAALLEKLEDDLDLLDAMQALEDYESAGGVSLRQLKADLATPSRI